MRNSILSITVLGTIAAMIGLLSWTRAVACGYPTDKSYVTEREDCGSFEWELQAQLDYVIWDEGPAAGSGTCAGGYYTCTCGYIQPNVKNAAESLQISYVGSGTYDIWWNITNWNDPVDNYCNPSVQCHSEDALQSQSVTSWIDYDEGYDEIQCYS